MANRNKALEILLREFPTAKIGLDNFRPYAQTEDGLYGVLFRIEEEHATEPMAIIKFTSGHISARNYEIVKVLAD